MQILDSWEQYLHTPVVNGVEVPILLKRYDPARGLNGTFIMRRVQYVNQACKVKTGGHLMLKHLGINIQGWAGSAGWDAYLSWAGYPMYAHARVHHHGPYSTEADLPAAGASLGVQRAIHGPGNIFGGWQHYNAPSLDAQWAIDAGWHAFDVWAAASPGPSIVNGDVDDYAVVNEFNTENTNQFHGIIFG